MKISSNILAGIIGRQNLNFDKDGTRRFANRVVVSKRATLCRAGSVVRIPITIVDLSNGGVGFINSTQPASGDKIVLRVTDQTGVRLAIECIVRWCKTTGSGRCRVGAEFLTLVEDEEELQPSVVRSDAATEF